MTQFLGQLTGYNVGTSSNVFLIEKNVLPLAPSQTRLLEVAFVQLELD